MSAATERALVRKVAILEKKLMILTLRFEAMDKAAAIMGGSGAANPAHGQDSRRPRAKRHLRVVR